MSCKICSASAIPPTNLCEVCRKEIQTMKKMNKICDIRCKVCNCNYISKGATDNMCYGCRKNKIQKEHEMKLKELELKRLKELEKIKKHQQKIKTEIKNRTGGIEPEKFKTNKFIDEYEHLNSYIDDDDDDYDDDDYDDDDDRNNVVKDLIKVVMHMSKRIEHLETVAYHYTKTVEDQVTSEMSS